MGEGPPPGLPSPGWAERLHGPLLQKLGDLGQTLGTARDLLTIFRALRDFAIASTPFSGIFISLYDPERRLRRAVYAWSEGEEADLSALPPMPMSESPHSRAVATGEVVITDDFQAAIAGQPKVDLGFDVDPRPPRSSLAVPMAVMGRTVGAVEVQSCEPAAFGPEHATTMRMAANLAAVALENVRLLDGERTARAAAEEASRMKDEFLAVVSHELRTPLTAIFGWTRLLRSEPYDPATAERALETIERNAKAQGRLIEDLLDISRMITGKLRLEVRPLQLAWVLEAAVEAVRPAARAKHIRLDLAVESGTTPVAGDPNRLQQALSNLLSNAIKFTPPGGRVEIRAERREGCARIVVRDTGKGISPEFLPHVFDRFRQADSTITRSHGGLGLGLAIVRHLVQLHGGTVHAESGGEGQGATFTVSLPLSSRAALHRAGGRVPAAADEPSASARLPALEGLQVLVVDDDADARELLALVLQQRGADVRAVASAAEAHERLACEIPDVLVSDIGMPGEDGYELLRRVRAGPSGGAARVPALALTAHAGNEDRLRAFAAGYQMYVPKPVDPAELVHAVANLAGRTGGPSMGRGGGAVA